MRLRDGALSSVWWIALLGLLPLTVSAQIQKDQISELLPAPEELGEGWKWTNPDRPFSDLGFQFSAYYDYRAEGESNTSAVVDIRTYGSADEANAACAKNRKRYETADQVVLAALPSLGAEGFRWPLWAPRELRRESHVLRAEPVRHHRAQPERRRSRESALRSVFASGQPVRVERLLSGRVRSYR